VVLNASGYALFSTGKEREKVHTFPNPDGIEGAVIGIDHAVPHVSWAHQRHSAVYGCSILKVGI
jgi:hypothetical protein